MLTSIVFIITGLILLTLAGDKLVDGAIVVGKKFKLSDIFIGIVIVGFGTSLPEMLAGVIAAKQESSALVLGNMIGSNIANIGLVLAVGLLLIRKFDGTKNIVSDYILMLTGSTIFIFALSTGAGITVTEGFLLILTLHILLVASYLYMNKVETTAVDIDYDSDLPTNKAYIFIFIGIIGLYIGAELLIHGAIDIASSMGISERIIGLTVVAIGTSLPELAATFAAVKKSNLGLVFGNVCGSNLFNLLAGVGLAATIYPLPSGGVALDIVILGLFSVMITGVFFINKKYLRYVGGGILLTYIGYLLAVFSL